MTPTTLQLRELESIRHDVSAASATTFSVASVNNHHDYWLSNERKLH